MTESEVATTHAAAPKQGSRRRPAWIAAALVLLIVAMLSSPRGSAASTPSGPEVTHVVLAEARDIEPRVREDVERVRYTNAAFLAQPQRTGLCALHPFFCRYRGLYQQVGVPFLVLCAIVLPCWLVFRLYRRRALGRPLSARREILLLTFVFYLLGLATLTLTPNRSSRVRAVGVGGVELRPNVTSLICSSASLPDAPNARAFCTENAAGNVLLFFPLGVLLPLIWGRFRFWRGIQVAIALSLGIELVQYFSSAWGSYRATDVNDVILNVLGASLGLALVSPLWLRQRTRPRTLSS